MSLPITFAQAVQYGRRRYAFGIADQFGAGVVHQDLVRAALDTAAVDAAHLFLDTYPDAARRSQEPALAELRREVGASRVQVKTALELPELARTHRYAFVVPGVDFQPLGQVRRALAGASFPICALLHSIDGPAMSLAYVGALLFAAEQDAIVATSDAGRRAVEALLAAAASFLAERMGARAPAPPRIVQIPLGVDTDFLTPYDRATARQALGLPATGTLILYLGRLDGQQKADLAPLLTVCHDLFAARADCSLVLAGQDVADQYGGEVRALAGRLGIAERLTVITNFPHFVKPLIYSACDVFVSPVDNLQETFGLSVIEAMACGLPVVAADWSGYKDTVVHGETGFKVATAWNAAAAAAISPVAPLCDYSVSRHFLAQRTPVDPCELYRALDALAADASLRRAFGENGRRRAVEVFGWRPVMAQWSELWREQWQRTDHRASSGRGAAPFDYNALFGHFASAALGPEVRVHCSRRAAGPLRSTDLRPPAGIDRDDVLWLVARCAGGAASLGDLVAERNRPGALDAAAWALKQGYLERVG